MQQPPQCPTPDLRLLQSNRHLPPSWEAGDSKSYDLHGEPLAVGLPGAGLRIKVQREAGPSANSTGRDSTVCAFTVNPPAHPHESGTSTATPTPAYPPLLGGVSPSITPGHGPLPAPPTLGLCGGGLAPYGMSTAWRRLRPRRAAGPVDSPSREEG